MNTKHTPGPWIVDGQGIGAIVRGSNGVIVAVRHRQPSEEHEANARLIAAAPELLDLAHEIADNAILAGMEIGQRSRELIAKATGEQA